MYSIFVILIIGVLIVACLIKEKNWSNPITVFTIMWEFICILAGLRLYDMYEYDERVFFLILLGVLGVFLGYFAASRVRIRKKYTIPFIGIRQDTNYVYNNIVIIGSLVIAAIIYLLMSLQVIGLLLQGFNTATIREMYRETGSTTVSGMALGAIYGSNILKELELYIAQPVMRACVPIFALEIVYKRKISKISILSVVVILLYTLSKFGRFGLMYLITDIIICYCVIGSRMDAKTKRKIKRVVYAGLVVFAAVLVYLSLARWENNILRTIYAYFAIPAPLFEHWVEEVDSVGAYSYGISFIQGLMEFIVRVTKKFGIVPNAYNVANLYNYNLVDGWVHIAPELIQNAYVSMFFSFYLDFREIGIVVESFIFGWITSKSYKRAQDKKPIYVAFYLLLFQCLVKSFVRWDFVLSQYWLSFLFLRLWFKKDNNKKIIIT